MGKIALLFPGQGTQVTGMGKDFYDNYDSAKEVYEIAGEATGIDVAGLCFNEDERLNITEYTQIALLTTEVAILKTLTDMGLKADYLSGLSLGEYGALAAAQVMDYKDLFKVIKNRGKFMQDAYPVGGAMTAVLGLDADKIKQVCESVDGIVSIANDNCPGQIVITGEEKAVAKAGELLAAEGAKRRIPLKVSGPFHSALLKGAGEQLAEVLAPIAIKDPVIPYISNVTADVVADCKEIKNLLAAQVYSPVRFRESVLRMQALGVTDFIEIGPGKTMSGFVRKTDRELNVVNVEKIEDIENVRKYFS